MTDAHVLDVLVEIRDVLRRIEAATPSKARPLTTADRLMLQRLFPMVDGRWGGCVWTVADLLGHALEESDLAEVIGDRNARQLGRLFARADGMSLNNWRLVRGTHLREGWLWSVERV